MVANEVLRSRTLSWKAKGLYAYLFSKPDDWDFSSNRIIIESADGRSAIMAALRELETCGYLVRNKLPNGKMDYFLKHSTLSQENELRVAEPKSENCTMRKLHSAETELITNIVQCTNIDKTHTKTDTGVDPALNLEYLLKIPEEDIKMLMEKSSATSDQITSKGEDLHDYCSARSKRYKNYRAFLRNAIKRDYPKNTIRRSTYPINPTHTI